MTVADYKELRYLHPERHARLRDQYDHICRQLTKMMADAGSWCAGGSELREVPPEYLVERGERESVAAKLKTPNAQRSGVPDAPNAPRS